MFDIGLSEVFIVLVVALFVIGPDRLPQAARNLGMVVRKGRKMLSELRSVVDAALAEEETPSPTKRSSKKDERR